MINLLKNEKITENSIDTEKAKSVKEDIVNQGELAKEQTLDKKIEKYKDSDGLTVSKLNLGLWLVRNRPKIIKVIIIILAAISIITWSIFIFTFGYYVFFGMKQDEAVLQGITNGPSISHDAVMAMAAKDLRFQEAATLKVLNNRYDFFVLASNPNDKFYAEFDYYFLADNKQTETKHGFLLPRESKYFFQLNEDFQSMPDSLEFRASEIKWTRIDAKKFPDWENFAQERLNITTGNIQFFPSRSTVLTEKVDLNELKFTTTNNTIFNYWQVNLKILLYSRGNIIGVNEYAVENLMTNESRDIVMTLPGRYSVVDEIKIIPEINITKSDIYINYDGGTGSIK